MSGNWKTLKLGDCVEILTGFPFNSKSYSDEKIGVNLLRGDNVVQGKLKWDGVKK